LEGLSLFLALLPMAFDAMTEDLMEEHAARAAGENSRRGRGGDDRRFLQGMQVVDHFRDGGGDAAVVRQPVWRKSDTGLVARQHHAVRSPRIRRDEQSIV